MGGIASPRRPNGLLLRMSEKYGQAPMFSETFTIFNIKGNKYRLVVWIDYRTKRVFIRNVMSHADYLKGAWKNDCTGQ